MNNMNNEMNIKDYIKKFTILPDNFIDDFYFILDKDYVGDKPSINLNLVSDWLNIDKSSIKRTLVRNFEDIYDYTIEVLKGKSHEEKILLTSNCFKELCMISRSKNSKLVRKYFIEMERLIKTYYTDILNYTNRNGLII